MGDDQDEAFGNAGRVDGIPIKNRIPNKKSAFLILSNANYLFRFFVIIIIFIIIIIVSSSHGISVSIVGRKKLMYGFHICTEKLY